SSTKSLWYIPSRTCSASVAPQLFQISYGIVIIFFICPDLFFLYSIFFLSNVPIYALCDTGATHSFISRQCLESLGIPSVSRFDALEVCLASGKTISTDTMVHGLEISIGGQSLEADAYIIDMQDFDVILAIDWLIHY
ncbi:Unknown protein, partial [Striga hermonthica]